jgi:probable F420-dependent oxidoreductase
MQHGTLGVWYFTETMPAPAAAEFAQRVESLGYTTLWLPETVGRDPFAHSAFLFSKTTKLQIATGIANIYHRHPGMMKQGANTLAEQSGGRFTLGIGVSHAPLVAGLRGLDYSKPVATMRTYLEGMQNSPYGAVPPKDAPKTVLAALGPKMLELSRDMADGAHPYLTTPEHTATARQILGPNKLLCVEQKVCLIKDATKARTVARQTLGMYMSLPNYFNNWKRLGFTDEDLKDGGSDRLIDALVAWGDEKAIETRIKAHQAAGASHVCIQPLLPDAPPGTPDWKVLEAMAPRG